MSKDSHFTGQQYKKKVRLKNNIDDIKAVVSLFYAG